MPVESRSRLGEKLARGEFPVLVEIVPPKGCDPAQEIEGAQYLLEQGIEAVNIPDGAGATARMSALTLAALLQQRVGVEVLLHYSSRDRNVLTIQSDLLGAHALGVRNVLALTQRHHPVLANAEADVSEVDAIGLVNLLNNLNRGLDASGNPLGAQTSYLVGVGANPETQTVDKELRRFQYKVEAGADFALTLPVFEVAKLAGFVRRSSRSPVGTFRSSPASGRSPASATPSS